MWCFSQLKNKMDVILYKMFVAGEHKTKCLHTPLHLPVRADLVKLQVQVQLFYQEVVSKQLFTHPHTNAHWGRALPTISYLLTRQF